MTGAGVPDGVRVSSLDPSRAIDVGAHAGSWLPLRHELGITAFGLNAWVARRAGEVAIERHDELGPDGAAGHEEVYVVVRGAARFVVDGHDIDAPAGTVVFVSEPALIREAVALEDDTVTLTIGGRPQTMAPSDWEQAWLERHGGG